ncbi:MAG: hypothetical protein E4H03_03225, partial [Myxococcales bacterium]
MRPSFFVPIIIGLTLACSEKEPTPNVPTAAHASSATREKSFAASSDPRSRTLSRDDLAEAGPGNWRHDRQVGDDVKLTEQQRDEIAKLEALGYMTGSREIINSGVTRHDPAHSFAGANFYTAGHAAEALLVDMKGRVLHRWAYDFGDAFPGSQVNRKPHDGSSWWCWAHLYENGDLIGIYSGVGIVKLNARSELLWALPIPAHHDVATLENGDVYVLTRHARVIPHLNPDRPILEDFITLINSDGAVERSFSLIEAFEGTTFSDLWIRPGLEGDAMHTNAVELLDGRGSDREPAFRAGNLLVSLAYPNLIAVVDPATEKVVWAAREDFASQHDPGVLEGGHILLFDNVGLEGSSRALELDPVDMSRIWQYSGSEEDPLFSF